MERIKKGWEKNNLINQGFSMPKIFDIKFAEPLDGAEFDLKKNELIQAR